MPGRRAPTPCAPPAQVHVMIEACLRRCLTKQQTQALLSQRFGVQPAFSGLGEWASQRPGRGLRSANRGYRVCQRRGKRFTGGD